MGRGGDGGEVFTEEILKGTERVEVYEEEALGMVDAEKREGMRGWPGEIRGVREVGV